LLELMAEDVAAAPNGSRGYAFGSDVWVQPHLTD